MTVRTVTTFVLFLFLISCGNTPREFESLDAHIDYLVEENRYEEALALVERESAERSERDRLLEKVYLNYGLYNMSTFDAAEMRTRMNDALRQFVEVLRINADNQVARNQIDQILQVYETIPGRDPDEDVMESLRELGYTL